MEDSEDDDQHIEVHHRKRSSSILQPLFFVFCVVIGSAVIYDCQINGSFRASKTSHLLHEYGVFSAYQIASSKAKLFYGVSRKSVVKNVPLYYATFAKFATPYVRMILDWIAIAWNVIFGFIFEIHMSIILYGPYIFHTIDSRFPVLFENVMWCVGQVWTVAFQVIAVAWTYIGHIVGITSVWLYENVFVGPLAVDKLQQHMHSAVDQVQSFTIEAFNWLHQQILASK